MKKLVIIMMKKQELRKDSKKVTKIEVATL